MNLSSRKLPRPWQLILVTAVLLLATADRAIAQAPHRGQVRRLNVITLSLEVGSTDKESRQVTYSPPPGWYVRSHSVECSKKTGHSSYSVSTVPRDWRWSSEEKVHDVYRNLLNLAIKARDVGLQMDLLLEREQRLNELRRVRSSHHALVVEATVKGEGFLRGGGSLELIVTAELVYVGTEDDLARDLVRHHNRLR